MTEDDGVPAIPEPTAAVPPTATRLIEWRDKLIDLSRANRLLAYRATKASTITIVDEDPHFVAKRILDGKKFTFLPKPEPKANTSDAPDLEGTPIPHGEQTAPGAGAIEDATREALNESQREDAEARRTDTRLQTTSLKARAERTLLTLYRTSRSTLEEQGFNTLHLAMGMLTFKTLDDPRPLKAPLLLIPVELTRRGARSAFRLSLFDAEVRVNPALIVKLRKEHGESIELPDGWAESDQPVRTVFDAFRALCEKRDDWTLSEDIALALFSFAKIPLYQDLLQHEETIGAHPIVQSLAKGTVLSSESTTSMPEPHEVEAAMDPTDTYQILLADSSQQAAILAAREGHSFVLQGPPGTGKSQTIANIIAEFLARGKRVLFVSEKIAALDVVKRRLDQAGLGPFCLEVHSRKANKREIVRSLASAWKQWSPKQKDRTEGLDELRELRTNLRAYVDALHEPRGESGYSAFEVFGRAARLHHLAACEVELEDPTTFSRAALRETQRTLEELKPLRAEVEPLKEHAWRGVRATTLGVDTIESVRRQLNMMSHALDDVRAAATTLGVFINGRPFETLKRGKALANLALHLEHTTKPPSEWIQNPSWSGTSLRVTALLDKSRERAHLIDELSNHYAPSVFDLDLDKLAHLARPGGWIFGWFRRRKARKQMQSHAAPSARDRDIVVAKEIQRLRNVEVLGKELDAGDATLLAAFGNEYAGPREDLSPLMKHVAWTRELMAVAPTGTSKERLAALASGNNLEVFREARVAWQEAHAKWSEAFTEYDSNLLLNQKSAFGQDAVDTPLARIRSYVEQASGSLDSLPTWMSWQRASQAASDQGLASYLESFEDLGVSSSRLVDTWFRTYWRAFADRLLKDVPELGSFDGGTREQRIDRFCDLDKKQLDQARRRIATRLSGSIPPPNTSSLGDGEIAILKREIGKERRHLPTRVLFDRIPRLLQALKPCLMMSPLSVATYLPPGKQQMDVVIFDEASQICTEDAIGAISRAEQVIVAGDSKQLPPTRFFERRFEEDEQDDVLAEMPADLPSVLDECKAGPLPQVPLRWHYRSLDESLISFSNRHFYENRLVTFPNASRSSENLGISFVHVPEGIFHGGRGSSRSNPIEAKRVAERVFEILRSRPDDSVGVVTFSVTQRNEVLDAIDALRREDTSFETRFDNDAIEPVFVKNLESVQGDERDVIVFSVGYARDTEGSFRHNFGPLTSQGGDRRLNVAVTRARKQVIVYASVQPEDIDLARTQSRGAKLLRAYMETARRGMRTTSDSEHVDDRETAERPELLRSLQDALKRKGHQAALSVGDSAFQVDVAVVKPTADGADCFALGILCDGPGYRDAATTRDRDRSRTSLLRRLGWRVMHVWTPDWLRAPDAVVSEVEQTLLRGAIANATRATTTPSPSQPVKSFAKHAADDLGWMADTTGTDELPGIEGYKAAHLRLQGTAEAFHVAPLAKIRRALTQVVNKETPIQLRMAARRVVTAWGMSRTTEKAMTRIEEACDDAVSREDLMRRGSFLWAQDEVLATARRPGEGVQREIDEIAPEEVQAAIVCIVKAHFSVSRDDILRETGRVFGFQRRGTRISEVVQEAIDALLLSKQLIPEGKDDDTRLTIAE